MITRRNTMNNYELMLLVSPTDAQEALTETKAIMESFEVKIQNENDMGVQKLAYKIKKSTEGHYVLLDVELDGKKISTMSKEFNLVQNLWRYIFVKKEA